MKREENDALMNDKFLDISNAPVKISPDMGLVRKYLHLPSIGGYELSYEIEDYVSTFKRIKKHKEIALENKSQTNNKDNSDYEDDEQMITLSRGDYINENLYKELRLILCEEDETVDIKLLHNISEATIQIIEHLRVVMGVETISDYIAVKKKCKETIAFIDFIQRLEKSQSGVKKIVVQENSKKKSNINIPPVWMDAFFYFFKISFEHKHGISVGYENFLSDSRKECELFLKAFPTNKIHVNDMLKLYAFGLSGILKDAGVNSANLRHKIIGQIFRVINVQPEEQPGVEKSPGRRFKSKAPQTDAYWVRQLIKRAK